MHAIRGMRHRSVTLEERQLTPARREAIPELLAPAGGGAALLGSSNRLTARTQPTLEWSTLKRERGAQNFNVHSLHDVCAFAHLRGAKVYLTANVIVLPDEMPGALRLVRFGMAGRGPRRQSAQAPRAPVGVTPRNAPRARSFLDSDERSQDRYYSPRSNRWASPRRAARSFLSERFVVFVAD